MKFEILKNSKKSRARAGIIKTPHGEIQTPSLVPVATQAAVKTLTSEETAKTGTQILIANTFHLHLKPGEKKIKSAGGIHKFMNWEKPLMTDSGGFQVFSLGFGKDTKTGKILKNAPGAETDIIGENRQPKSIRITEKGVYFRSPLNGEEIFIGPRESIKIQERIGADIIFAFDECTSPLADKNYVEKSLGRTHSWAEACLASKTNKKQALFGIIQGSRFRDLREKSAEVINSLGFDGFGIGGDMGTDKKETVKILNWVLPYLDSAKPRHLLGIGHPEDIEPIIKNGVDLFDCIAPTHYARRGIAFTSKGKINLNQSRFLNDKKRVDSACDCFVCENYKRNYVTHLFRAKEITGMSLLTFHNLYFFNGYVSKIREKIKQGKL